MWTFRHAKPITSQFLPITCMYTISMYMRTWLPQVWEIRIGTFRKILHHRCAINVVTDTFHTLVQCRGIQHSGSIVEHIGDHAPLHFAHIHPGAALRSSLAAVTFEYSGAGFLCSTFEHSVQPNTTDPEPPVESS